MTPVPASRRVRAVRTQNSTQPSLPTVSRDEPACKPGRLINSDRAGVAAGQGHDAPLRGVRCHTGARLLPPPGQTRLPRFG